MKIINITIIILLHFLLTGCDTTPSKKSITSEKNPDTSSNFETYLKVKNIPSDNKKRVEIEKKRFDQRNKMVSVALEQSVVDEKKIDVEVSEYKKQLVLSRYFEQFLKDKVNDEAIRNFYSSNPTKYESKKIHVAHILIRTNPKMSNEEREALLTKAHEVYSKANAAEDFAELAKGYSDDKVSAKKGGDLGWIKQGAIDKAFSNKVFSMKQGDISEPISTPFGFHVVKILAAEKVIKQPFESVKGNIRYELRQLAKDAETDRLLDLVGTEKE